MDKRLEKHVLVSLLGRGRGQGWVVVGWGGEGGRGWQRVAGLDGNIKNSGGPWNVSHITLHRPGLSSRIQPGMDKSQEVRKTCFG